MDLFEEWLKNVKSERVSRICAKVKINLHLEDCSEEVDAILKEEIRLFCLNVDRYWKQCHRNKTSFSQHHKIWLEQSFDYTKIESKLKLYTKSKPCSKTCRGRPQKAFEEASEKTKKRRVQELLNKTSEELRFAAER